MKQNKRTILGVTIGLIIYIIFFFVIGSAVVLGLVFLGSKPAKSFMIDYVAWYGYPFLFSILPTFLIGGNNLRSRTIAVILLMGSIVIFLLAIPFIGYFLSFFYRNN